MNQSSPEQLQYSSKKMKGELAQVEDFVFATIVLVGILLLLGALRRRFSSGFLTFVLFVMYTAVSQAIPYIMGLMKSAPFTHDLLALWASILLLGYGSADNMTAFSLDETLSTAKFLWGFILQFIWLSLILFLKSTGPDFLLPLIFLIALMFLKVAERGMALSFANKTTGIESVTMRLADYMKTEHQLAAADDHPDPLTMRGYNYLVDVTDVEVKDHRIVKGVTVEQIWECQGRLLSSDDDLKNTCLSLALFWLLLRKFAGYPLHETNLEKTQRLVFTRLLSAADDDDPAKALTVIEVELNFLYDYFYTKYFFYFYNRHVVKALHVSLVLLFGAFTMYNLKNYRPKQDYPNFEVDVLITWVMVAALVLLEIVQLYALVTSRWFRVTLVCYYVKQKVWQRRTKLDRWTERVIEIICRVPNSATVFKPWQRKLSQYSLLASYKRVRNDFASRVLYNNLKIPITTMSKKVDSVELTPAVIGAVFRTLKTNDSKLTNGITSLSRNGVRERLVWACKFEMKTDLVLAWHVATALCELRSKGSHPPPSMSTNLDVAVKLSEYCAYLVAKAPKLLPDHAFNCKYIYNLVILDAKRLLKDCDSENDVYKRLVVEGDIGEEENPGKVLCSGGLIAKYLIMEIREEELIWKILAELWAELILFVAPSEEEVAHAERLAEGGEFITHLWALLIHAGIVSREEPKVADPTSIQLKKHEPPAKFGVYRRINTA